MYFSCVCCALFAWAARAHVQWQHVQHRCIFWIFYACSTTHTPNSFAVAILLFLLVSGARSLASIFRRLTFKNIIFLFSLCYVPFVCSAYMFSALTSKRACFVVCVCCAVLLSTSKMFLFHLCYLMHEQNLCVIYNAMSNWWARWVSVREQSQRYGKHTPRIQIPNTRPRYIFFLFFFLVCCCCLCRNFSFFSLSFLHFDGVVCLCISFRFIKLTVAVGFHLTAHGRTAKPPRWAITFVLFLVVNKAESDDIIRFCELDDVPLLLPLPVP